jgi:8-oxo-dGTP diphosphatase
MAELRVVAAAIVDAQRCFAARRGPGRALEGFWEFPGGKVETGEADERALEREILEELGVTVRVGAKLGESRLGDLCLVLYACMVVSGEVCPTEHQEVRWLSAEELSGVEWAPADVPLLSEVRRVLTEVSGAC